MVVRRWGVILLAAVVLLVLPNAADAHLGDGIRRLPFAADHVAVYWPGHPHATVRIAFSRDGGRFTHPVNVGRDDAAAYDHGITYGAIRRAAGARFVRLFSSERIGHLTVLAIPDHPLQRLHDKVFKPKPVTPQQAPRPAIIARADWGADESLRYSNGKETWPPAFAPTQKLIVHHTDTGNNDPNPASTVRAIYYYHAITHGWGDIGYNFLIDESGRIYKGRNSHAPGSDADTITGQDAAGNGVTGAHARNYNAGSVGVAMLGTLSNQDATPAAKNALEALLAWETDSHNIDPHGNSTYTSPVDGRQKTFANIAGHRDVGDTDCPGGAFYATLPAVRDAVAAR